MLWWWMGPVCLWVCHHVCVSVSGTLKLRRLVISGGLCHSSKEFLAPPSLANTNSSLGCCPPPPPLSNCTSRIEFECGGSQTLWVTPQQCVLLLVRLKESSLFTSIAFDLAATLFTTETPKSVLWTRTRWWVDNEWIFIFWVNHPFKVRVGQEVIMATVRVSDWVNSVRVRVRPCVCVCVCVHLTLDCPLSPPLT